MATQAQVAAHLGVSAKYINDLIGKGVIPYAAKGKYDIDACRKAYIEHIREQAAGRASAGELNLSEERARLAKEQADAKEMENAVERGDLVYIEDVAKQIENQLTKVRTRLLSVPTKVAPEAHACASVREVQNVIEQAITEALNELVGYSQDAASDEA
jgi:phage terminase Nu1 subunit (DNA packaging protein)